MFFLWARFAMFGATNHRFRLIAANSYQPTDITAKP